MNTTTIEQQEQTTKKNSDIKHTNANKNKNLAQMKFGALVSCSLFVTKKNGIDQTSQK